MISAPLHKTDLRRSLIRFSSTLVGLIAVVGIMSLFSIWSMNRAYIDGDHEIEKIRELSEEALLAQIDFKVQVQEWKNILLRGSDQVAKTKYMTAFENREVGVEKHLSNLAGRASDLELHDYHNRAKELNEQHRKLANTYREALANAPNLSPDGARSVDRIVLGIDRDLENNISGLSQEISTFNKSRRDALVEQLSQRYRTLRSVLLIIIIFSLAITAISLYGALRATRN